MPMDLPPTLPADSDPAVPEGVRLQSLGTARPLAGAYAATAQALGVRWEAVRITLGGASAPAGLMALLARHNPDLARQVGADPGRFEARPVTTAAQLQALEQADRQALAVLAAEGWLTEAPQVKVTRQAETDGGITLANWSKMGESRISMSADAIAPLRAVKAPSAQQDPVMLRWLTLFHEAAHAQLGQMPAPFAFPGWSAAQNDAMNRLGFDQPGMAGRPTPLFAENFADSYAVLLLLRLTGESQQARATLDYAIAVRTAATAQRQAAFAHETTQGAERALDMFDAHVTEGALLALRDDLDAGRLDVAHLTPAQLRAAAQRYASEGVVAFFQSPEGRLCDDFAWAHVAMDPATGDLQARSEALSDVEHDRAQRAAMMRLMRFAEADRLNLAQVGAPMASTDPMLQAMGERDRVFYQAYRALPASERHAFAQAVDAQDAHFDTRRLPTFQALFTSFVAVGLDALEGEGLAQQAARALEHDYQQIRPTLTATPTRSLGHVLGLTAPGAASVASNPAVALARRR